MRIRSLMVSLLVLSVPAGFLAWHYAKWRSSLRCEAGVTPSYFTFGYSHLRAGSTPSCLSSTSFAGIDAKKVELPFAPTPAMPLYWNGLRDTSFPPFAGRRVLVGLSYPAGIYAYDFDAEKVLWHHDFFGGKMVGHLMPINSPSAAIDPRRRRAYGTFLEERFVGKLPTDSRLYQHFFSIALDGSDYEERVVDFAPFLLEKGTVATPEEIRKYIRCRTALDLNDVANPPYLFFGCSIVRAFSVQGARFIHEASSQTTKGIRGMLLTLPIDPANGHIGSPKGARAFLPSKMGPQPNSGVDAGIWHCGGAPALLPDQKILLATGNGVYDPEAGNFGCSVMRIDGTSLLPDGAASSYFSAKGQAVAKAGALCHGSNLDPSASSPATLEIDGRLYSAIGGKDGWIKAFDPYQLPGASASPAREAKVVDGFIFGQPVAFRSRSHHMIISVGGEDAKGTSWAGYFVDKNFSLIREWTIRSPAPRAFHSSAAGTYRQDGLDPLLFVPLASGPPETDFLADLQAIDAESGEILGEFPFRGSVHFSMPAIIDDRVFLPTAEHGLYMFLARKRFRDYLEIQLPSLARFL